jgi:hypothetical protein
MAARNRGPGEMVTASSVTAVPISSYVLILNPGRKGLRVNVKGKGDGQGLP